MGRKRAAVAHEKLKGTGIALEFTAASLSAGGWGGGGFWYIQEGSGGGLWKRTMRPRLQKFGVPLIKMEIIRAHQVQDVK